MRGKKALFSNWKVAGTRRIGKAIRLQNVLFGLGRKYRASHSFRHKVRAFKGYSRVGNAKIPNFKLSQRQLLAKEKAIIRSYPITVEQKQRGEIWF